MCCAGTLGSHSPTHSVDGLFDKLFRGLDIVGQMCPSTPLVRMHPTILRSHESRPFKERSSRLRARARRVVTVETVTPNARAVSSQLNPST